MHTSYERFWAQVDRSAGPGGCWPWTGPVTAAGVGVFTVRGRRTTARRYAYTLQFGDPGALRVRAGCPVPACVNFTHLVLATARAVALSNGSAAAVLAAATCPHPRTASAMYTHPGDGRRECAGCKDARRAGR